MRTSQRTVVREVLRRIEREPGTLPWADVPGATAAFGSREQLLRALQMRWHAQLAAHLDAALETDGASVATAVRAYHESAATRPALRATLDRHRDDPALRAGAESELVLLATAAGLVESTAPRTHAVALGRRVRAEITAHARTAAPSLPATRSYGGCRATGWLRRRWRAA